jgi:hypothetical protein
MVRVQRRRSPAPVDGSANGSGGGDTTWTKAEVWKFFTQF